MYGVQLTNSRGVSLINPGEVVPQFHAKYAVSGGVQTFNTGIPSGSQAPLVFTRGQVLARVVASGGAWIIETDYYSRDGEIFVFSQPTPQSGKYGVQVFKPNGQLAYQSNKKAIRLLDVLTLSSPPTAVLARYDRKIAVNAKFAGMVGNPSISEVRFVWYMAHTDNTVTSRIVNMVRMSRGTAFPPASLIVIDVTGL